MNKDIFYKPLIRLKYLNKIFPKNYWMVRTMETVLVFNEAKIIFINRVVSSTIMMALESIEKKLIGHYEKIGFENITSRVHKAIIRRVRRNNVLHSYLLDKIDSLRRKRNSFSSLRPVGCEYSLKKHFVIEILNSNDRYF